MGRKKYSQKLKARIALDAIKGQKTMPELASEYGVHTNQIGRWKKQLLDAAPDIFTRGKDKEAEKKEKDNRRQAHHLVVSAKQCRFKNAALFYFVNT